MAQPQQGSWIVVGVDGSHAAILAAVWAIDEAISRDVSLRLVHVLEPDDEPDGDSLSPERSYGEEAVGAAAAAVHGCGKPVKVDTAILHGDVDANLLRESQSAAMICVGTVGIGRLASRLLGSTAVALVTAAHCPVAVIRHDGQPPSGGWIVVVVDDRSGSDEVVHQAMQEARLRNAPLLALGVWRWDLGSMSYDELDQRMEPWLPRYPDVKVTLCATRAGPVGYLVNHDQSVQLLVMGPADRQQITRLLGPHGHPILGHPGCSVLVVRH